MSYDVFISFKNSGKDGKATPDATAARNVYNALKSAGMKVFFSEESLAEVIKKTLQGTNSTIGGAMTISRYIAPCSLVRNGENVIVNFNVGNKTGLPVIEVELD